MMIYLLYIALAYLVITSGILYLNRSDFEPLQPIPRSYFDDQAPSVNICIPARNEADSIERCVRSAVEQRYPNKKVYVLDDHSTDGTSELLEKLKQEYPNLLSVIEGNPKPDDWLGKSWACHQLSQKSSGNILVFIDADTWLEPETTAKLVRTMGRDIIDFATIWPEQQLKSFWEKTIIPLVYFALLTLLPTRYVYKVPKWIPSALRKKMGPLFAAACGQFMAFKRSAYEAIGGHESVKNKVVEDVELAKNIKRNGFSMKMYHGLQTVHCRMYTSAAEIWDGFRKNFFAGFGYNPLLFVLMGFIHVLAFMMPILLLPFFLLFGSTTLVLLSALVITLMLVQRIIVDRWFNWDSKYSLLHPLAVGWFQMLGIQVLLDYYQDNPTQWKDRNV